MKKEIVYRTKLSVKNILGLRSKQPKTVWLEGMVERVAGRRLLRVIPLPDRYVWTVEAVEETDGASAVRLDEKGLTFESKKRLGEERLNMEEWLRGKCKEYKKMKYGKRG